MHNKKEIDEEKYIKWFSSLGKKDVSSVGGKAANLGEMYNIDLPVPQGFAVVAQAYSYFLEKTGLKEKIYSMLENLDIEDTSDLEKISVIIKEMIINAEMPKELENEIIEAYNLFSFNEKSLEHAGDNVLRILKTAREPVFVAVRSSATAEDSSEASFAGQQETFLNVKGQTEVVESVKKCWASLFSSRSIYYRVKKGFKHENVLIAVVIQIMINSDKSGVIFSRDPVNNSENIVVEAVYGLGEGIVSGRIMPDHYLITRELKILSKEIAEKKIALTRNSEGRTAVIKLTEERSNQQVLTDYEIKKLADYALQLEEHYNLPQDIEFAVSSNEIYIVQTRPITTLNKQEKKQEHLEGHLLLEGTAASPGIASGEVRVINNIEDLNEIKKGNVLVAEMTNPDMVVAMQKASAIITDEGGSTSHAAIVSREMGIACIVGTKKATKILKNGMFVTVDGFQGRVYEGQLEELKAKKVEIKPIVETRTKIKVIVDLPDFASRASETKCREVGLTRIEGIIAESGKHPFFFLKNNKIKDYEEIVYQGVNEIARHFDELWIRTSDIRSDEFRHLAGSPNKIELNPMLGMHGIRAGLKYPEILKAEIKALARIGKKIGVMMPQIISVDEVKAVKKIMDELGIKLKLGVMIETPAAVFEIEEICQQGIEFISFGTNDLTQYTLAIDRGNEECQYLYDETHPAVLRQLKLVIEICKKHNVETSICGQAGSDKKMVEHLIGFGIDSISVNADKAYEISEFVRELESKSGRTEKKKEKYKINCSRCSKETEVPFKPDNIRPVYCKNCFEIARQEKLVSKPVSKEVEKEVKQIETSLVEKVRQEAENLELVKQEKPEEGKKEKKEEKSFYQEESQKIINEEQSAEQLIEESAEQQLDIF